MFSRVHLNNRDIANKLQYRKRWTKSLLGYSREYLMDMPGNLSLDQCCLLQVYKTCLSRCNTMFTRGLKSKYIRYPIIPPIVLVMISVISATRKPLMSGCNNSILRLKMKVRMMHESIFCFFTMGNRNPNGIIMTTFNIICLTVSPLPLK